VAETYRYSIGLGTTGLGKGGRHDILPVDDFTHLANVEVSMSAETMRWYPTKVDWWLGAILFIPPIASIGVCVSLALGGQPSGALVGLASVALVIGIYVGLIFPMKYGVDDTHLLVRFGLCRQRIPLADVEEVHPTHNPLSSPALSLDRLHVRYGEGIFKSVMISPSDRNGFLDELARRTTLKRKGDRLVRV
jgi:hypothetical protein